MKDRCEKNQWESIPGNGNLKFPKWELIWTIIETENARLPGV